MEGEQCFICSKPAALRCGECGAVYCGHHAKYHLHPDTGRCFPFSVARVAGVGRVLLAAADLAPGDEIFREEEMVVGPSRRVPPGQQGFLTLPFPYYVYTFLRPSPQV